MTYHEALAYLDSFINHEKKTDYDYKHSFKLDRMRRMLEILDDPQKGIKSIHVAGTKGKGSTAIFIYSILMNAGYKVGLYTSPHLVSFRERIRVDNELISEESISRLLEKVKWAVDKMGDDSPSFFEVYTALAFMYFREERVDFAVYEVGLGGRLDATNVIESLVSVITPISYEHTDKLGNTIGEIAAEKAGIIKHGSVCVSAPQDKEALEVIEKVCAEKDVRLILAGRDIISEESESDIRREIFNVRGLFGRYMNLETALLGSHQVINAAVAIGAVEALRHHRISVDGNAVHLGVSSAEWGGRFEIVRKNPFVVLDGAQNRASAKVLAGAVNKIFSPGNKRYEKLILVIGISSDKDIRGILDELIKISDLIILTKSGVAGRAAEPSMIAGELAYVSKGSRTAELTANVGEAIDKAFSAAGKNDLILVTGSLFVVGEARNRLMS